MSHRPAVLGARADARSGQASAGELPPAARALQQEIVRLCQRQQQDQHWRQDRLQTAEQWAQQGRLYSAIGLVEPLAGDDATAARRKQDWAADAARLDRYVREFEDYLDKGRYDAAEAVLRKACEVAPGQPQVLCMERSLLEARPVENAAPRSSNPPAPSGLVAAADSPRLLLSGLPNLGPVLILRQPMVLVGTSRDPSVHLPLQAMLHRRHAVLLREKTRAGVRFRVAPLAGCAASVNGRPITDGQTHTLNDGDVLQFGNEHCRWTFRQPETDACRTLALLHQTRPASACAVATDGTQVRCVFLAGDELAIGRDRTAAHLVEPGLPIRQLRLAWQADGLYADAIGGMLFVNGAAADVDAGVPVGLPAELAMYADGNGLVGEALQGTGGRYEMKLDLRGDPHA